MKVLHLYSSYSKGGAEKVMLSLIKGLEEKGIVNVVGAPKKSYLLEQAKEMGVKACPVFIKGSLDPIGIVRLFSIVKKENIDIIHAHQGKVFWPCIFVKWLFKPSIKIVFHRHAEIPHKWYSRKHYQSADAVIAISKAVADSLIIGENVPKDKVKVVYNGIDLNVFNTQVPAGGVRVKYGFKNNLVVGTVAAMNRPKGKGQGYLIEAAKLLSKDYPDMRFLIVGDGEIRSELESLAKRLGVGDSVVFTGYQENVREYIAAMDIFCLLSWDKEGFGQVMVEAQAMGKPVIGTNVGGVPETFVNQQTGLLIPKEDVQELARAIRNISADENRRKKMGENALAFARDNFSYSSMVSGVMRIYNEIQRGI